MSQITLIFIFLGVAVFLLIRNILRPDIVALMLLLSLGLTGILTPQEAFSGFSRSAVVIMFSAYILAEGLRRTGITEHMGLFIVRLFGNGERRLIFGIMAAAAMLSLFMNNIAAASLLFPALSGVARRSKISPARLLMPLAFGTILGGMATLLTSTNIVVSGLLRDAKLPGFGLLDFAPVGLPVALAGVLFMVFWGYKMLPTQSPAQKVSQEKEFGELLNSYQLNERFVRVSIPKDGILCGKPLDSSQLREKYHLNVVAAQRGKRVLQIAANTILKGGDNLLIVGRPEDTTQDLLQNVLEIQPLGTWQDDYLSTPDMLLIEAAIAPRSPLAGQSLQEIHFEQKFNAKVLAIWREGRSIRTRFANLPLQFGDGLLLQGTKKSLDLLRTEPGLILLAEPLQSARMTWRSWTSALIMVTTLGLAAVFPTLIAEIMLSGAIGMILIGALTMDNVYRSMEWRSLFLVGGMLPLGIALTKTGGAALLANSILRSVGGRDDFALLFLLVLLTVLLTQVINGVAAVSILAPIGISAARQLGVDPRSIALGVALASSMAFMSPLGHSVNIMVMGAGGYTFRDYARVGVPLTIILVVLLLVLLPMIMPLR